MSKSLGQIAFALAGVLTLGVGVAHAQSVYGIKHPPAGSTTAYIYEVDLSTSPCGATLMASPNVMSAPTASWNGNAYDSLNDRYYFTQFDNAAHKLWMLSGFSTSATPTLFDAGTLIGGLSNGTFYDGKYYYIAHGTDDLYEVALDSDGTVSTVTKIADVSSNNKSWYFGDIAYGTGMVLYGSVADFPATTQGDFFSWDGSSFIFYPDKANEALQIAFGGDGVLYGYSIASNKFYSIDTASGAVTEKCTSPMDFSDLANWETPDLTTTVVINVHPYSDPNPLNLSSGGTTPVAILGSEDFDVMQIDLSTLTFANATVKVVGKADKALCSYQDIGSFDPAAFDKLGPADGIMDLVCHFITAEIAPTASGDIFTVTVNGNLLPEFGGTPFSGEDVVKIVK